MSEVLAEDKVSVENLVEGIDFRLRPLAQIQMEVIVVQAKGKVPIEVRVEGMLPVSEVQAKGKVPIETLVKGSVPVVGDMMGGN